MCRLVSSASSASIWAGQQAKAGPDKPGAQPVPGFLPLSYSASLHARLLLGLSRARLAFRRAASSDGFGKGAARKGSAGNSFGHLARFLFPHAPTTTATGDDDVHMTGAEHLPAVLAQADPPPPGPASATDIGAHCVPFAAKPGLS